MERPPGAFQRARLGFRRWRRTRPFWAGIWTMLGGLIILYGPLMPIKVILVAGQVVWMGIMVGVLVAILGLLLWFERAGLRRFFGVLIVLLGLVSLITSDFGGFFIGMLLALIGGSMAIVWRPLQAKTATATAVTSAEAPVGASGTAPA